MPDQIINFVRGDDIGSETDYRDNLPVNMIAINHPLFGANGYMIQHPGLTQFATASGADRGGVWNERMQMHFRVSGTDFVSVDASGNVTVLGTVAGNDTVSLPYSFNTQAVISSGRYYLYDTSNGFREVTDADLGDPIDAVWVDGYYFFTDGNNIYHTDISDESSIDPLNFATAEFMPDPSNGVAKTVDNKVMVFGRYSTEFFINDASTNFSFRRVETRAIKVGIVSTHCKAEMSDAWYIVGGRKEESVSVYALGVGSATKVATREVEKILNTYTESEYQRASIEARVEDEYSYLIINLLRHTLIFNENVARAVGKDQAWSILKTDVQSNAPWRGRYGVFDPRKGQWIYGDRRSSNLGILDETVATHFGDIAEWILYTPFMYLDSASIDMLEIETIPGFNVVSDDATVAVSLTHNGVNFGMEWFAQYGGSGEHNKRFIIRRLGYVADWVAIKLRGATRSRMAFSRGYISYG